MIFDLATQSIDAKKRLETLINNKAIVEIKKKQKKRSVSQNAFLHVLCGLFGLEFGYTIEEVKTDLKKMFPDIGIYTKKGKAYLKSTKDMDSKELTELIELFRRYSAQAGLYLPDAEEYLKDSLYFDSQAQSRWLQ